MEINPCPCCGYEAVQESMKVRKGWESDIHCNGCLLSMHTITYDTEEQAIAACTAAWNRRAESGSNPLTLDELRQMDGEAVWTVGVGANKSKSYYALVMLSRKSVYTVIGDEMVQVGALCQYGKTWLAYRHKPERSEG